MMIDDNYETLMLRYLSNLRQIAQKSLDAGITDCASVFQLKEFLRTHEDIQGLVSDNIVISDCLWKGATYYNPSNIDKPEGDSAHDRLYWLFGDLDPQRALAHAVTMCAASSKIDTVIESDQTIFGKNAPRSVKMLSTALMLDHVLSWHYHYVLEGLRYDSK